MTTKVNPMSIGFKNTASAEDIIAVLNSLSMATSDPTTIANLRKHENIILTEITGDEQRTTK